MRYVPPPDTGDHYVSSGDDRPPFVHENSCATVQGGHCNCKHINWNNYLLECDREDVRVVLIILAGIVLTILAAFIVRGCGAC